MTVFLWPDEGMRYCELPNGAPAVSRTAVVYADVNGNTPAVIKVYDGTAVPGAVIPGAVLTLDIYGQLPQWWGPDFPTATVPLLYIRVNSGPITPIGPNTNLRLTALEAGGGGGGSGTPSNTVTTETTFGQAAAAGAATTYSRGDHTHGTPAAPSVPAAATTVQAGTSYGVGSAVGTAASYAREDHQHGTVALTGATPTASAVGDAGAVGAATLPARADHVHGREAFGAVTAQTTYAASSASGSAVTVSHSDHTHGTPALTANAAGASAVGDTAAVGTGTAPARDDHRHAREAFAAPTAQTTYGLGSAAGSALTVPHSDHTHGTPSLTANTPAASAVGDAAAVGTGTAPAKDDHKHAREAFGTVATATAYGTASTNGVATTVSRGDHNHGSPSLTANAAGASAVGDTAAVGTGTAPARDDHRHAREAFGAVTAETSYGLSSANGSALTVPHSDHTHGTPALPTAAQVGAPALSVVTTKGDLYVATASGAVARLGVGSDTQVLTADSTQTTGVKWAAGGAGSYSLPDGIDPPSGDSHVVPPGPVSTNLATVSGTGFFVPVPMGANTRTLNEIALDVTGASGASGVFRAVLFSATGRRPNVSLIDFGTISATSTGVQSWTALSQLMSANTLYYLAIIPQVAAGGSLRATQHNNAYVTIHSNLPVASTGWACYAMSGLSGAVSNGTAFVYLDVDPSPRVGLKFA